MNSNVILACKHFQNQGLNFTKHTKFVINLQIQKYDKAILRQRLIKRGNVWIKNWKLYKHKH